MSIHGRIHFLILVTGLLLTTSLSAQRNFGHDHHVFHRLPTQSKRTVAQSPSRKRIGGGSPASKSDKPISVGTGASH